MHFATPLQTEAVRIANFVRGATFETIRLARAELDDIALAAGTEVYVSAVPTRPADEQIAVAAQLRAAGLQPTPHVAARNFASAAALDTYLARMTEEAGVRRILVIGGDREQPSGPFHRAIDIIESGLPQSRGIVDIGLAGYPDGHARIADAEIERALVAKIAAASETGVTIHIVAQFAFSTGPIVAWIGRMREIGIEQPIRIGLAGPASVAALMRFAAICGVRTSARALARNAGLATHLFGLSTPAAMIRQLAAAKLDGATPHFFSFGGLGATARWATAVAAGHFSLGPGDGFVIDP
jgi:methylenetetrahydrofolate reductase (NADPH)